MSTYRGMDGYISLGGMLSGTNIRVRDEVAIGANTLNVIGTPLTGAILPGDRFTIPGAGTFQVTNNTALVAVGNEVTGIHFTPVAPSLIAAGTAFVLASASVAQVRQWGATSALQILDTTVMQQTWATCRPGVASWTGTAQALFDYADPEQKALVDAALGPEPVGNVPLVFFGVGPGGIKGLYGAPIVQGVTVEAPLADLVTLGLSFTGTDAMLTTWTV